MEHRFYLKRGKDPELLFILLNPSTATQERNDHTLHRLAAAARQHGYTAFSVANLFTLRTPHPRELKGLPAIGDGNRLLVRRLSYVHKTVVYAWGNMPSHLKKQYEWTNSEPDLFRSIVPHPLCFRHTKTGHPNHPCRLHNNQLGWEPFRSVLYWMRGTTQLEAWLQAHELSLIFDLVHDHVDGIYEGSEVQQKSNE